MQAARTATNRIGVSFLALMFAAICLTAQVENPAARAEGQESETAQQPNRRRLPNYFAKVVTPQQREEIYKIQEEFEPQIAALRKQLQELVAKRDKAIRSVLSPEQQKQLDALIAEAKQKAANRRAKHSSP